MARIYSPNENHNFDINGVQFIWGAGAIPDAKEEVIAWFTRNGYDVEDTGDALTFWDKLPKAQLLEFAAEVELPDTEEMTKAELVAAIEAFIADAITAMEG